MVESTGVGVEGGPSTGVGIDRRLSVVVIARDERERIRACLESVLSACDGVGEFEVVVVDSRSTDGTVAVASEFPTTVLRLPAEPPPSPGAGRHVGTAATSGDLVLFVDGDMILADDWLEGACERVRETADLAGVDGHLDEGGGGIQGQSEDGGRSHDAGVEGGVETDVLRGVVLYDRSALADVGGFDPHLQSMEDIDLSYRLAAAGYRLVRLPTVVAGHPSRTADLEERARRWANGYYHGRGELFRKHISRPRILARLAYRTRLYFGMLAWAALGVGATRAGGTGVASWTAGTVAGLAASIAMKGTGWTVGKLVGSGPVYAGLALGFLGRRSDPSEYPLADVETLESAPAIAERAGVGAA